MNISWITGDIAATRADLVAVPFVQKGKNRAFEALDRKTRGSLSKSADREKFKGEAGRVFVWQGKLGGKTVRVAAMGVGKPDPEPAAWRFAVAKTLKIAARHRVDSMAVFVDSDSSQGQINEVGWTAEALALASYRFNRYKSSRVKDNFPLRCAIGVFPRANDVEGCRNILKEARVATSGISIARDLVNEPANVLSPEKMAEMAGAIAAEKGLQCKIFDEKEIRGLGMNLLLAVAAGSGREPRFVHLIYRPKGKAAKKVVLVGKGITFDSGGLCVKTSKSMEYMKTDMAGAAVVIGVMSALRDLRLNVEVHGIVPVTDNMINGLATRPGDIFKARSGVTVEVVNTDAEGRLILADALSYAEDLKPDLIIDHATLTGACVVALGQHTAGLFSADDELSETYLSAAKRAGESYWRLPLCRELDQEIKSSIADIKNTGGNWGGAITAALFLKRFVKKSPWIHLDIAGPARAEKSTELCPAGGTGFGVLTALSYLKSLSS